MCLSPLLLRNERKENGKISPYGDFLSVPCGKCVECLENKIAANLGRLIAQSITPPYHVLCTSFITLTIQDDERHIVNSYYSGVDKSHIEPLLSYLRKCNRERKEHKQPLYHWFVTSEYGSETDRPHYHMILYGTQNLKEAEDIVHSHYDHGHIKISECQLARFRYVANSHISKCSHVPYKTIDYVDEDTGEILQMLEPANKPFVTCSRGIGYEYVKSNLHILYKERVLKINGVTYPLHPTFVNYIAKLKHVDSAMLWYHQKFIDSHQLHDYYRGYPLATYDKLGINPHDFDEYNKHDFNRVVTDAIKSKTKQFQNKYVTKKSLTNNV